MARLIIRRPGWPEEHLTIDRPTIIGRGAGADVRLDDPAISTQHCRIEPVDEFWSITDLKSRTGTFIGEVRLTSRFLKDIETVRIAGIEVEFHSEEEADEPVFANLGDPGLPVMEYQPAPARSAVSTMRSATKTPTRASIVVAAPSPKRPAAKAKVSKDDVRELKVRKFKLVASIVALLIGAYLIYGAIAGESSAPNPAVVNANWVQPAGD